MRYDFHRLKTIHCLDAVTIRVPERWTKSEPGNTGSWKCYEDVEETGTLWIRRDRFEISIEPTDPRFERFLMHCWQCWTDPEDADYLVNALARTTDGYLWRRVCDTHDAGDGTPIRNFGYTFFQVGRAALTATDIKLVLPCFVLDEPDIRELIDIMGRKILAVKLAPHT